jgi:hypothetical protein
VYPLLEKNLTTPKKPLGDISLEIEWKFVEGAGDKAVKSDEFAGESNDPVKELSKEDVRWDCYACMHASVHTWDHFTRNAHAGLSHLVVRY